MGRILWKVAFGIASLALAGAALALALSAPALLGAWLGESRTWVSFAAGTCTFFALWWLVLRRLDACGLAAALDHELVHALAALPTGGRVRTLSASALGQGSVTLERPNPFVAIAPYLVSLPLGAGLLVTLLAPSAGSLAVGAGLGALCGYHLARVVETCRPGQSDFDHTTYPVGLAWTVAGNALLLGLVASVATGRGAGGMSYVATLAQQLAALPGRLGLIGA